MTVCEETRDEKATRHVATMEMGSDGDDTSIMRAARERMMNCVEFDPICLTMRKRKFSNQQYKNEEM